MIVAKDPQGVQKSLGGDKFAVSWRHNGTNACTTGKSQLIGDISCICDSMSSAASIADT